MKLKNALGCIGFICTTLGMSSLDSEGPGYKFAIALCVVGYIFLLCYGSKGGKR